MSAHMYITVNVNIFKVCWKELVEDGLTRTTHITSKWMVTSLCALTRSWGLTVPASSTPSVLLTTGPSRISWTHLVFQIHKKKHVEIFSIFWGCEIYAYDHTIKAPPRRGKNIKYFKTGLGTGSSQLKTLKDLITQNNHTADVIEYLKVINIAPLHSCLLRLLTFGNLKKLFFLTVVRWQHSKHWEMIFWKFSN